MSFARRIRLSIAAALFTSAVTVSTMAMLGRPASADASTAQLAMFQDPQLGANPIRSLQIMRSLGVGIVRLGVQWKSLAPDPNSRARPAGFDAANPADYPSGAWQEFDTIISYARAYGIRVDLLVDGGAPLWAAGSGAPSGFGSSWKPSAADYGQFVQAVGTRYSGAYTPVGATSPLPRVNVWEFWDEGNWGPALAPQILPGSRAVVSAKEYRSLLDSGWSALWATGHGHDTIIDGSLSQDGSGVLTPTATTAPLTFLRSLYCVSSSYRPLTGNTAATIGCPTTKAASRRFAADNPALFRATGIGLHPYPYGFPPNRTQFPDPNGAEFSEIPQFVRGLRRLQRAYGSRRAMAVFNTEYGYETRPPQTNRLFPTPATAAIFLNWAEYLSWKNPQIATTDQYELQDHGWFTTGLLTSRGKFKPSFYAYRLPVWLPVTATKRGRTLEVWGCVRPAQYANADTGKAQYVEIEFARGSSGAFRNLKAVRISNSRGYFDVRVRFPSGGQVRLAWEYPPGDTKLADPLEPGQNWIYSRATRVTLR
jgi:hypothetical protein